VFSPFRSKIWLEAENAAPIIDAFFMQTDYDAVQQD
jgi:hypothetical protein